MILRISVQSISDLITNSSSEIFQFKTDLDAKAVEELIRNGVSKNYKYAEDSYSGMGGHLTVEGWEDVYKEWLEYEVPENKRDQATPEVWAILQPESLEDLKSSIWVDVDWSRYATIHFILSNFWVTGTSGYGFYTQIDPETKKIVRYVTKEMYNELPENCKGDDPHTECD